MLLCASCTSSCHAFDSAGSRLGSMGSRTFSIPSTDAILCVGVDHGQFEEKSRVAQHCNDPLQTHGSASSGCTTCPWSDSSKEDPRRNVLSPLRLTLCDREVSTRVQVRESTLRIDHRTFCKCVSLLIPEGQAAMAPCLVVLGMDVCQKQPRSWQLSATTLGPI